MLLPLLLCWQQALGAQLLGHDKVAPAVTELHIQATEGKAQQQLLQPDREAAAAAVG
jgi:hypothetical protein